VIADVGGTGLLSLLLKVTVTAWLGGPTTPLDSAAGRLCGVHRVVGSGRIRVMVTAAGCCDARVVGVAEIQGDRAAAGLCGSIGEAEFTAVAGTQRCCR
jgi:hypothetical protein